MKLLHKFLVIIFILLIIHPVVFYLNTIDIISDSVYYIIDLSLMALSGWWSYDIVKVLKNY